MPQKCGIIFLAKKIERSPMDAIEILGLDDINQIFDGLGLTKSQKKKAWRMLYKWREVAQRRSAKRVMRVAGILRDNLDKEIVMDALKQINAACLQKRISSRSRD